MKRRLRPIWTCSDFVRHEHRWRWSADLCGKLQQMKIKPVFKLADFWVGIFWDADKRRLYLLPIPCVGIVIQFSPIWTEGRTWEGGVRIQARKNRKDGEVYYLSDAGQWIPCSRHGSQSFQRF